MKRVILLLLVFIGTTLIAQEVDPLEDMLNDIIEEAGDTVEGGSTVVYEEVKVKEDPREFVIRYYDNIKKIPLEESYKLLSPRFQEKNGNFQTYSAHVNSFESIKVVDITTLEATLDNQKVKVDAFVEYVKNGKAYKENYILTLMYHLERDEWIFH